MSTCSWTIKTSTRRFDRFAATRTTRRKRVTFAIRSRCVAGLATKQTIRVYGGLPDPTKQATLHAVNSRQTLAWTGDSRVTVFNRPLRYPSDWSSAKPMEKGIDVALAVDLVRLASQGSRSFVSAIRWRGWRHAVGFRRASYSLGPHVGLVEGSY